MKYNWFRLKTLTQYGKQEEFTTYDNAYTHAMVIKKCHWIFVFATNFVRRTYVKCLSGSSRLLLILIHTTSCSYHSIPIYDLVSDSEILIEIIVIISGLASYFRIHGLCIEYGEGEFYFRSFPLNRPRIGSIDTAFTLKVFKKRPAHKSTIHYTYEQLV